MRSSSKVQRLAWTEAKTPKPPDVPFLVRATAKKFANVPHVPKRIAIFQHLEWRPA
jgi:hypothetical protein